MQNEATSLSAPAVKRAGLANASAIGLKSWYVSGLLTLLAAVPLAYCIAFVNSLFPGEPEKAIKIVGVGFAAILVCAPATYLTIRRHSATLQALAFVVVASVLVLLVATYLYSVSAEMFFPADILIWSESDFVNDIIKFRQGFPIFTAQVNNQSFTYVPGTQLLTYSIAWLLGHPLSIATYRTIQVGYTVLAAIVGVVCCRQLLQTSQSLKRRHEMAWGAICLPLLFLIATNQITNPFSHLLHNDALAQLVTVVAYSILLAYAITGNKRLLWLMVLVPSLGFWVKQSLAVWAVLYCVHLALFDQKRSIKRLCIFAIAAFGALAVSIALGYALWGQNFGYWVFTVLGGHGVSPLRSLQHVLEIWPYYAIGILGGLVLLQRENYKALLGPWVIWLCLISIEAYTSGVAWMLNHIGPGCLIAGVWFLAALTSVSAKIKEPSGLFGEHRLLQVAASVAIFCLLLSGLGVIRVPLRSFGSDANRYVADIEKEFQGQQSGEVLLDHGSWVYASNGIVMKDRAASIGERGYSETGDFSGLFQRVQEKHYSKILVRNLHSNDFWYDHDSWRKSSGIRQVLLENYREVGTIAPVAAQIPNYKPYGLSEISILVPRNN